MKNHKRSPMNKSIVVGLVVWLILIMGLGAAQTSAATAAGKLTLTLEPSLDGKGNIRATSLMDAKLSDFQGIIVLNDIPYKAANITNGTAQFSLSAGQFPYRDEGNRYIMINNLYGDLIPTRIDDPTKDIHQFVGEKLRVSVIGNLSDPTYQIETFTQEQGEHPAVSYYDGTNLSGMFGGNVYTILSLKTNPQRFQVITLGAPRTGREQKIIDYTPAAPNHPSTSTSINPSFSKWMFGEGSHGDDYDGDDSKCSTCHGNLDTKPSEFSDIMVNNGFCFRCHYGKGGSDKGFVVDTIGLGIQTSAATTASPTPAPTTATPKIPAFEAFSAIAALLAVLLIGRK
ncbi:MAG: hypothetical protein OIN66_05840 [Candidatus Methanoperedens sp.]|nr:hypothetical protein [Candidatus Methanoperedens sp.]